MSLKNIPLYCKQCSNVELIPDFSTFYAFVNRKWDFIWQQMNDEERYKTSLSKVVGPLAIADLIDPKKLRKKLEDEHYIQYACRDCFARVTENWYKKNNYQDVIRYGRVIVSQQYYNEHKGEVDNMITLMRRQ